MTAEPLIEDYAMIGNCRSAALVGRNGSIDWLCWPRFDSAACFAALLGNEDNGRWLIEPQGAYRASRRYRDSTLILETEFQTEAGAVSVTDFMVDGDVPHSIVRKVTGLSGSVPMHTELILRFDYGRTVPWMKRTGEDEITAIAGPNTVVLRSAVPLDGVDMRSVAEFQVAAGESHWFTLSYGSSFGPPPPSFDGAQALSQTESSWRSWAERCAEAGPWTEAVKRSLLTLRGLTYFPTGGIVAAPTTSLPERLGGERNWDYRFCWLRDATFTLLALMNAGYYDEAAAWRNWLTRAIAGHPDQIQIVYGVAAERDLPERELPWLSGFANSAPVRVGNAASEQFQLDIFGEMADMMVQARRHGLPASEHGKDLRRAIMDHLERVWHLPDEGIWEVRGSRQHFTYSKVMAWAAFQHIAEDHHLDDAEDLRQRWKHNAEEIHAEVCRRAYDPAQGCFVQAYDSPHLDASLLLLPLVGFLPADDPRVVGTIEAIERRLLVDGLVLRYETGTGVDGLPQGEGAFLACSFWLVDCQVLLGRLEDARRLYEKLLSLCNDVGLLAEEYDPRAKRMLGNFPQAFSHVALVNAGFNLARALKNPAASTSPRTAKPETGARTAPDTRV